jgi:hypothetical protein
MGYYLWASVAKANHLQAYLVVTYEFDASASTAIRVSAMVPMDLASPIGGTTSADYQRGIIEFQVPEPATVTSKQIAFYPVWTQAAAIAGLNMRIGTGSFVAYTDTAAVVCGGNGAMVRNDAAFTMVRGKNVLNFDCYRTDTADLGWMVSGFWIINYNAGKPAQGVGAANNTVFWGTSWSFEGVAAFGKVLAALAITIPETDYYINKIGTLFQFISQGTSNPSGITLLVERLAAEGGIEWEPVMVDLMATDPETGLYPMYASMKHLVKRWPSDPDTTRFDIETARRWMMNLVNSQTGYFAFDVVFTYHAVLYTVAGTVSSYADADGAGLTVRMHRDSDGELLKTATTTVGGAFTFTWYDNVDEVFVAVEENSTHVGRSVSAVAT